MCSTPRKTSDELRTHYRAARRDLHHAQRKIATEQIHHHLDGLIARLQPKLIAAYLAFDGEVDLSAWLQRCGTRVAVPVIDPKTPGQMHFAMWSEQATQANRFGISEPADAPPIHPDTIDLLLAPLVAWDDTGVRLGMGGGYYDRYLHTHMLAHSRQHTTIYGIGFTCQHSSSPLPRQSWDVPLTALVSEAGITHFATGDTDIG
ncbi:MAG: 5-formyltetrahydrofolate cyclo-ligase [Pseudomonadota bacterium]